MQQHMVKAATQLDQSVGPSPDIELPPQDVREKFLEKWGLNGLCWLTLQDLKGVWDNDLAMFNVSHVRNWTLDSRCDKMPT